MNPYPIEYRVSYVITGLLLSVFLGLLVGGAVFLCTANDLLGWLFSFGMTCFSLDMCFRGRND